MRPTYFSMYKPREVVQCEWLHTDKKEILKENEYKPLLDAGHIAPLPKESWYLIPGKQRPAIVINDYNNQYVQIVLCTSQINTPKKVVKKGYIPLRTTLTEGVLTFVDVRTVHAWRKNMCEKAFTDSHDQRTEISREEFDAITAIAGQRGLGRKEMVGVV